MVPREGVVVRAVREDEPGRRFKELFTELWSAYEKWFLREGEAARPTYAESVRKLTEHMPELLPLYQRLIRLAGDGDRAARLLSLYRPTPYLSGCTQAAWTGDEPALVRNYDYSPSLWEGLVLHTRWLRRKVVAMTDCLWGVLDGINEDGLAVALSFGGRRIVGDGFGCPLLLRYVLEQCRTAAQACRILQRVPTHMAYNVTLVDAGGDFRTLYLSPDRPPIVRRWPIATNHQETVEWEEYSELTASVERERYLADRLGDPSEGLDRLTARFLEPPLFSTRYQQAHGTLYTAIYRPARRSVTYLWPGASMEQSFDGFKEMELPVRLPVEASPA